MDIDNESELSRINRNDPNLTELTLECPFGELGEDGGAPKGGYFPSDAGEWEALGRGIGANTHLKAVEVDLITWIGDEDEHASLIGSFCQGLSQNRSLQRFALRFCDFDLFEKGILQNLVPFLEQNHHLRVFDLYYSPIECEGARLLSSTLERRTNKSLEKIVLSGTVMLSSEEGESASNELLTTLKEYKHLKVLEFEMNDIGPDGYATLSTLLRCPDSKLQHLNLRDSGIDNDRLLTLMTSLSKNTALQVVDLSNNPSITPAGWAPLLCVLQSPNCNLKKISLNDNAITCDVAVALAISLTQNRTLTCLNLGGNPSITNRGFLAISALLRMPGATLEVLDLSENELDDGVAVDIANSLADNCTLRALRLGYNPRITTRGFVALSAILRNPNSELRFLDLKGNSIDDKSAIAFASSLTGNNVLKALCLGKPPPITASGWAAFAKLLCDTSSIYNTYASNHTLDSFKYSLHQMAGANMVYLYLELNKRGAHCRRRKILITHFNGHFSMRPFAEMKVELLVHVVAWIGKFGSERRGVNGGNRWMSQSAFFHFLRRQPSLFGPLDKMNAKEQVRVRRLAEDYADGNISKNMCI